ncbi:MAG: nicotinate-nucleotide adenylyltransferase [Candidatus Thiodiazotropha sp.]
MIGVFGGTFDPIHFGHLRTALDVMQGLGLEEVRFIPLHGAVHRDQPATAAEQRLEMVRLATRHQKGFVVDDREIKRAGDSYTVETLASLRQELPKQSLCLLLGMDAFNGFADWYRPDKILALAHLVVMHRPGEVAPTDPRMRQLVDDSRVYSADQLTVKGHGAILFQPVTQLDISASHLRNLLAQGLSPRFLLPEAVLQHIDNNGLYRANHTNQLQ